MGNLLLARGRESPAPAPQGGVGGHLLARGCIPAPQGGVGDHLLARGRESPAPALQRFIPQPPKRKKTRLQRKRKLSSYNFDRAKEALGLDASAHNLQVYSAAATASTALPLVETPLINSPTKDEVKAENKMLKDSAAAYKRKILSLESKNENTTRKAERLHVRVRSLSESLKMEKKKSRMAIEQLLILTTAQHNELMSKFQEKIQDVHAEHDRAMCSLQDARRRDVLNNQKSISRLQNQQSVDLTHNQKSIERLQNQHSALLTKLKCDYQNDLTQMENCHNKSMVCSCHMCFILLVDK